MTHFNDGPPDFMKLDSPHNKAWQDRQQILSLPVYAQEFESFHLHVAQFLEIYMLYDEVISSAHHHDTSFLNLSYKKAITLFAATKKTSYRDWCAQMLEQEKWIDSDFVKALVHYEGIATITRNGAGVFRDEQCEIYNATIKQQYLKSPHDMQRYGTIAGKWRNMKELMSTESPRKFFTRRNKRFSSENELNHLVAIVLKTVSATGAEKHSNSTIEKAVKPDVNESLITATSLQTNKVSRRKGGDYEFGELLRVEIDINKNRFAIVEWRETHEITEHLIDRIDTTASRFAGANLLKKLDAGKKAKTLQAEIDNVTKMLMTHKERGPSATASPVHEEVKCFEIKIEDVGVEKLFLDNLSLLLTGYSTKKEKKEAKEEKEKRVEMDGIAYQNILKMNNAVKIPTRLMQTVFSEPERDDSKDVVQLATNNLKNYNRVFSCAAFSRGYNELIKIQFNKVRANIREKEQSTLTFVSEILEQKRREGEEEEAGEVDDEDGEGDDLNLADIDNLVSSFTDTLLYSESRERDDALILEEGYSQSFEELKSNTILRNSKLS